VNFRYQETRSRVQKKDCSNSKEIKKGSSFCGEGKDFDFRNISINFPLERESIKTTLGGDRENRQFVERRRKSKEM